jgi:hypothetical protein
MTTATSGGRPATRFLVDGTEYGGGPATFCFDGMAVAVCTADPEEVRRLLPSPLLHPVRWFNGRAVVIVAASGQVMTIGEMPPVRFAEVSMAALVTYGRSRAVPVLPVAGALLPFLGGALDRRYRTGMHSLPGATTNRVAAEVIRLLFGLPEQVAAVREDRSPDRLRFTATDPDGALILDLEVPAGGRVTPVDQDGCDYFVAGAHLIRSPYSQTGPQAFRLGGSKARLRLGQHPLADQLRRIGLSPRPLMTIVQHGLVQTVDRAPERLAPAAQPPPAPAAAEPLIAPMVIGHEDGHEETVDQLLDQLPFDAAGTFERASG